MKRAKQGYSLEARGVVRLKRGREEKKEGNWKETEGKTDIKGETVVKN
jgi:hypothetical protein